jgi:hypothetical protein
MKQTRRSKDSYYDGKYLCKGYLPVSDGYGRYRFEHDLVMEKYLGRKLKKDEVVHHINGKKSDNHISNLQIMTQSEHMRIHDNLGKKRGGLLDRK